MAKRLAAAFAVVVLLAVVLREGLAWRTTSRQISHLAALRHAVAAHNVTAVLGAAYTAAGSWPKADLFLAQLLAARSGATLQVLDSAGARVTGSRTSASVLARARAARVGRARFGAARRFPVRSRGSRVGTAVLRFPLGTPVA